jgi:hypothetical protein
MDTLKSEWIDHCLSFARRPSDLWSSDQKIFRKCRMTFGCWDDSLQFEDVGFTSAKLLERNYLSHESRNVAVEAVGTHRLYCPL